MTETAKSVQIAKRTYLEILGLEMTSTVAAVLRLLALRGLSWCGRLPSTRTRIGC
ncbi:hypothetical protein R1CP_36920 (plasmid) [Rhodococcus opacus]|uniref:Uncharacterized protein n=1 Tax=Rhodococcus opacus TaxID=37919 RepID=A0A1B1KHF2_RHOOP|nr:hypothetical protein R1CP_36920 [Rhodococcus opacus]